MPNWELVVPGFYTKLANQPTRQPASQPPRLMTMRMNVFEKIELHMLQPKNSKQNFCKHTTDSTQTTQTQPIVGPLIDGQSGYGHY
jgi:hypothetical protein